MKPKGPQSERFTALDSEKLRGGYYTTHALAKWLCSWAIQAPSDTILEPSCGDGAFISEAALRFVELGATKARIGRQIHGVEIVEGEANAARMCLGKLIGDKNNMRSIECADFFDWCSNLNGRKFDCVVGNPPFIRYHSFPASSRDRAMALMSQVGLTPNRLTNIWVPFVSAASTCLSPGGRLAMVLPAELLQVTYASQLRSFLVDRFARIDIVACNELFFPNAEQEVVLLLADDALESPSVANTCRVAMIEAASVDRLVQASPAAILKKSKPKLVRHDDEKWLKYFLSPLEISFMRKLRSGGVAVPLSNHASVDVGVVTGKNSFFVLTQDQIVEHGLQEYVMPLVGRAAHLRGAELTQSEWRSLSAAGERVHLFHVRPHLNGSLSAAGRRYVRLGEAQQINQGYKCSIRKPWYSVPSIWNPSCFFFRQIYDFPRLVVNRAGATSTDTIHRLRCAGDPDMLAASIYTHLTAASAEIEGRSYGGGVLELEPTEAERLLVPAVLGGGLPISDCDRMIREGRLQDLLDENDRKILVQGLGLSEKDALLLRRIWHKMRDRRCSRRRTSGVRSERA